jgi:HSP20 family protein
LFARTYSDHNFRPLVPSNFFSGFDDFFDEPFFTARPAALMKNFLSDTDMVLHRSSPKYEITEDEDKFQLSVDVPDFKAADIDVTVEQDGRVLRLSGHRKVKDEHMESESRFEKSFMLGKHLDLETITANLADGVLVVNAPKKPIPDIGGKTISITENAHPEPKHVTVETEEATVAA